MPVWIRMDQRPYRPGLRVVHASGVPAGVREFGPYLGGVRVRLAVSALDRILPLAYAGTGLTGAEVDMARQRGVTPEDRPWIVDALAAILARNPDAVGRARGALAALRDRAGASLAFELAGQITSESRALDWVTSPQRVTSPEPETLDVFGWSGGLLVHYGIRNGRLTEWSQRACSARRGELQAAATPAAWAPFAQRNAELAAALAQRPA